MPWLTPARETVRALCERGAHAVLLHGPAGTGKWDLALSLAREELCEDGQRGCGRCPSCLLFAAGSHPDLRVIVPDALAHRRPAPHMQDEDIAEPEPSGAGKAKPSREIKIDQVRELADLMSVTTHRGGMRVVALGPAEALNVAAANSLLKSLEEPPPRTLFLLVADQIDRCLPTVVSRCALVRVPVPARDLALAWLRTQGIEDDAPDRLVDAGGAPVAIVREETEGLDASIRSSLLGLLRRGAALRAADIAVEVPRTVPIGASVALFQRWGWDYFSFRTGGGLRYHPEDAKTFELLAERWSLRAASAWLERLARLAAVSEHPLNARSAVEGALLDYWESLATAGDRT